jgi:ATP-dependent Lon protease
MNEEIISLPMVALRGLTVLPEMVRHFDVSREKSIKAIQAAMEEKQKIFLSAQKNIETADPGMDDVFEVGCIATIKQVVKLPKKMSRVLIVGESRARIHSIDTEGPYLRAEVAIVPDVDDPEEIPIDVVTDSPDLAMNLVSYEAMARSLKEIFKEYLAKDPKLSKELAEQIDQMTGLQTLVDVIAANSSLGYEDAQELLEETDLVKRYELLVNKLVSEIQVLNIKEEIQKKVKERVDKSQREYILREEMKLIREELGDDNTLSDADEYQQRLEDLEAPDYVKEKIQKEIKRFRNSMASPAENGVTRTYIETMLEMPWDKMSEDNQDISYAKKVLDEDHYGLGKVKERVLEFLAVRTLTKKGDAPILCLVGPPGTGKTSIARSLARALQKKYVRISLGGVRDEAEIRGHRKTYVGAMPGRIAGALRLAGVKNPLMLLDEIDKVSNDYKGDTFSALLEVLDSEQNRKFRDHYLEVPVDLSEVLFVTTANNLQTIPRPLLDRMEVIEISSYTENEKLHIAQEHLIPKQIEKHGLTEEQLTISKKAIWKMAHNYTREAGVRQLERKIGDICRKSAREILEKDKKSIHVTERNLSNYLGKEIYSFQMANEEAEVGIVRGLAWTSVGGDTLQIEVNVMPGQGEILLTGQLGDVMKESARTGISYIRSVGYPIGVSAEAKKAEGEEKTDDKQVQGKESWCAQIEESFFKEHDIHIHIPEGAVPKDGPSAGITMATAMYSAFTGRKVRADLAMTGEITLRGRVLPIGGLKEKLLAAKNAGIKTVLIPKENVRDVEELSAEITKGLEIIPVAHMDEVLRIALVDDAK